MLRVSTFGRVLLLLVLGFGAFLVPPSLPTTIGIASVAEARGRSGPVHVRGYYRKDGTYVQPHYRSAPDGNFYNNWSTKGNVNPYTGKPGTKVTPPSGYGQDVYVEGYYRSNGTYVKPHYRSAPDGDPSNNWSRFGNINPHTGELGTRHEESGSGSDGVRVRVPAGPQPVRFALPVLTLQVALLVGGHDPGPLDGIFGTRTKGALRDYVSSNGLQGAPADEVMSHLSRETAATYPGVSANLDELARTLRERRVAGP